MRKSLSLTILSVLLLSGCANAPRVLIQAMCPRVPELQQESAALEPSFTDRMQSFLQGNLPELNDYSLTSNSVRLSTEMSTKP